MLGINSKDAINKNKQSTEDVKMTKRISGRQDICAEPCCIKCRALLGPARPIGTIIGPDGSKIIYDQATVGTTNASFCQCLRCIKDEKRTAEEALLSSLTEEQRKLFRIVQTINELITSYNILKHS
jgi:hypothetical protein